MTTMRISQLAERTGVPATALRFYEGAGLLSADRTPAGYRVYGEDTVERLAFIGAAKHLGLRLDEVGELIGVWEGGACTEVKASLRPKIAARLAEAARRTAELRAFTSSLHAALERLDELPDRSGRCDSQCGFLTGPVPAARPTDMVLAPSRQAGEEAEQRKSAAVACSLSGEGMAERTSSWHAALDGAERVGIPDGLRLTLPAERAAGITELAVAEQRCCPFFDFRLHLDGPHLHLDVRVPADGAGLLTELFGPVT